MEYRRSLSEPWFSLMYYKIKKVEGRLNKGDFAVMKAGDIITFTNDNFGHREFKTTIKRKTSYKSFRDYLKNETLEKTLPTITNIEDGLDVYYKYFSKKDEDKYGVVCFRLKLLLK